MAAMQEHHWRPFTEAAPDNPPAFEVSFMSLRRALQCGDGVVGRWFFVLHALALVRENSCIRYC